MQINLSQFFPDPDPDSPKPSGSPLLDIEKNITCQDIEIRYDLRSIPFDGDIGPYSLEKIAEVLAAILIIALGDKKDTDDTTPIVIKLSFAAHICFLETDKTNFVDNLSKVFNRKALTTSTLSFTQSGNSISIELITVELKPTVEDQLLEIAGDLYNNFLQQINDQKMKDIISMNALLKETTNQNSSTAFKDNMNKIKEFKDTISDEMIAYDEVRTTMGDIKKLEDILRKMEPDQFSAKQAQIDHCFNTTQEYVQLQYDNSIKNRLKALGDETEFTSQDRIDSSELMKLKKTLEEAFESLAAPVEPKNLYDYLPSPLMVGTVIIAALGVLYALYSITNNNNQLKTG